MASGQHAVCHILPPRKGHCPYCLCSRHFQVYMYLHVLAVGNYSVLSMNFYKYHYCNIKVSDVRYLLTTTDYLLFTPIHMLVVVILYR